MREPWRVSIDAGGTFTDCIAVSPAGELFREKVLSDGTLRLAGRALGPRCVHVEDPQRASLFVGRSISIPGAEGEYLIASVDPVSGEIGLESALDGGAMASLGAREMIEIHSGELAPILAIHLATRTPLGRALPAIRLRLATTRATNALLEREYPTVAMFVTRGFRDLLEIGDQRRPDLFALDIRRQEPVTREVFEVGGRLDPRGEVVEEIDLDGARGVARLALGSGVGIAAIVLLHASANPAHELALERVLIEEGFGEVVRSSDVSARIHYLARAQTTAVEAALSPVLGTYLETIRSTLGAGDCRVMASTGGMDDMGSFRAVEGLLSGPAGGAMGALSAGRSAGFDRVISLDMGGTSTDISRIDGRIERVNSHEVGGVRIARPAISIETVAAGGGSICEVRDGRPAVGPRSASAMPGPACYGSGGPLTLTDVNLLLGRLVPDRFQIPLDVRASRGALETYRAKLGSDASGSDRLTDEALLVGLLELADEQMGGAIRRISVRRGYDPGDYTLIAFGGAGPQHACSVCERLGISTALVPQNASLLSAIGVSEAPIECQGERQLFEPLEGIGERLEAILAELEDEAIELICASDRAMGPVTRREVSLRFMGQQSTIELDASDITTLGERFRARSDQLFGDQRGLAIEVESCRVIASIEPDRRVAERGAHCGKDSSESDLPARRGRVHDGLAWGEVDMLERCSIMAGEVVTGPALIVEDTTTTWVARGWRAVIGRDGSLILRRVERGDPGRAIASPMIQREIVVHRLDAIAENMGEGLARMAISTNIKERKDYSCGVLDARGRLIASAPHIPVHLGALGACVRAVIDEVGPLGVGDAVVTNHPAFGGSHLPDMTVVQGVHDRSGGLLGYVASRAHHAEIGGLSPGSMPAHAKCLGDEGVVFGPTFLTRAGRGCWEQIQDHLREGCHPSRAVSDNLADLRAAVGAGRIAARQLADLDASLGTDRIEEASSWILEHTKGLVREAIDRLDSLPGGATERLDQGDTICLRLSRNANGLLVDFTGTSRQRDDNLNAPLAVTSSVVAYVMRLLLGRDVPLNDGLLWAVEIRAPEGTIVNPGFSSDPARCPAVAAGNVEISQRLVEAFVRALRLCAGSQGTMNNVLLGNDRFGYYETIGGGTGAGPGFAGASGVHSHMTNTAITDPEIMEHRYPVRVESFGLRRGSGGGGRWTGGDGVIRELRALESMTVTVIAQRRVAGAPGIEGGGTALAASQEVVRADGTREALESSASARMEPADRLIVQTPGGGGWGTRDSNS